MSVILKKVRYNKILYLNCKLSNRRARFVPRVSSQFVIEITRYEYHAKAHSYSSLREYHARTPRANTTLKRIHLLELARIPRANTTREYHAKAHSPTRACTNTTREYHARIPRANTTREHHARTPRAKTKTRLSAMSSQRNCFVRYSRYFYNFYFFFRSGKDVVS